MNPFFFSQKRDNPTSHDFSWLQKGQLNRMSRGTMFFFLNKQLYSMWKYVQLLLKRISRGSMFFFLNKQLYSMWKYVLFSKQTIVNQNFQGNFFTFLNKQLYIVWKYVFFFLKKLLLNRMSRGTMPFFLNNCLQNRM